MGLGYQKCLERAVVRETAVVWMQGGPGAGVTNEQEARTIAMIP